MSTMLLDTCVLIDVLNPNSSWYDWAVDVLSTMDETHKIVINPIVYSECSIAFDSIERLEKTLMHLQIELDTIPREALFLAGKAFLKYKRSKGNKINCLPDFFIGAHASVNQYKLITRDGARFEYYFPNLTLIKPH